MNEKPMAELVRERLAADQAEWEEFRRFNADGVTPEAKREAVQAMRLDGCTCPRTYSWHFAGCIWADR